MATPELKSSELKLDPDKLYLEEVFTDRRIGTLRRLTPVTKDGKPDASKTVLYVGETQIMTPAGSIPIAFEIGAESLGEAAEKFSTCRWQAGQASALAAPEGDRRAGAFPRSTA